MPGRRKAPFQDAEHSGHHPIQDKAHALILTHFIPPIEGPIETLRLLDTPPVFFLFTGYHKD